MPPISNLFNGTIKEIKIFTNNGKLLKKQLNTYDLNYNSNSIRGFKICVDKYIMATIPSSTFPEGWPYDCIYYNLNSGRCMLTGTKDIEFRNNDSIVTIKEYQYNENLFKKYEKQTVGGDVIETYTRYVTDFNEPISKKMK